METTSRPLLTIIITAYNRPHLLQRAVQSALEQTVEELEVIVVDDGSTEPVHLPTHPRLRMIRLPVNRGVSTARNVGCRAAHGQWIAHLDDDDQLLPHFAEVSLKALAHTNLPNPVAVLSGLEVVNTDGEVIYTYLPPTLPRGSHFGLERTDPKLSFFSKQTLVVEREVLVGIGGFDESNNILPYTEMFLRLNPVCSLLGLPVVTYRQLIHGGSRLSLDPSRWQLEFDRVVSKHESFFDAHPRLFAAFILRQAHALYKFGELRGAFVSVCRALQLDPFHTLTRIASLVRRRMRSHRSNSAAARLGASFSHDC